MPWTQEEHDALEDAVKTGALEVTYSGPNGTKTVKYRKLSDMLHLLDRAKADLEQASGAGSKGDLGFRYLHPERGTNR